MLLLYHYYNAEPLLTDREETTRHSRLEKLVLYDLQKVLALCFSLVQSVLCTLLPGLIGVGGDFDVRVRKDARVGVQVCRGVRHGCTSLE